MTRWTIFSKITEQIAKVAPRTLRYSFILEPIGRDTAAAACLAMAYIKQKYSDNVQVLILPIDQYISDEDRFQYHIKQAQRLIQKDRIVLLAVKPDRAATDYDYLKARGSKVIEFVRKPPLPQVYEIIKLPNFFWNTGFILCKLDDMLTAAYQHCNDIMTLSQQCVHDAPRGLENGFTFLHINSEQIKKIPQCTIEHALIEKLDNASVVVCDMGWQDMGNWNSFTSTMPTDANGNRVEGKTFLHDCSNVVIKNQNRVISAIGVKDLIVVDTQDALLIADRSRNHSVKQACNKLIAQDCPLPLDHNKEIMPKPWGYYHVLFQEDNFKIKKLAIYPQRSISLQSHSHRTEHWVIVRGSAVVFKGEETMNLSVNQVISIQAGEKHRIANQKDELLIVVEVQVGTYLEEGDIARY